MTAVAMAFVRSAALAVKLVHATDPVIIRKYLERLKHRKLNMAKLNKFRLLAGNCKLEYR